MVQVGSGESEHYCAIERVIKKTFAISIEVTDRNRNAFKIQAMAYGKKAVPNWYKASEAN